MSEPADKLGVEREGFSVDNAVDVDTPIGWSVFVSFPDPASTLSILSSSPSMLSLTIFSAGALDLFAVVLGCMAFCCSWFGVAVG